jgi:copper chaperone CopZ
MKSRVLKIAIPALVLFVVIALTIASTGGPGTVYDDGDVVGKIITDAKGSATYTTPATFSEGDPAHEASHVYQAFAGLAGVERVEVHITALTVTVKYDPSIISEAALKKALQDAGYLR